MEAKLDSVDRVIGGMFALHLPTSFGNSSLQAFPNQPCVRLVNASSAIWLVVSILKPSTVWLPSYLCPSIVKVVRRTASKIRFYAMDQNLRVSDRDWLSKLRSGDLVLFIDYFGFPADSDTVQAAKSAGTFTIRDASQALLTHCTSQFDYTVYSPRKTLGVPDGGLLFYEPSALKADISLESPPGDWQETALITSLRRAIFDISGGENHWYSGFQELEATAPVGPFFMSELSAFLLDHCFNMDSISQARRDNYAKLGHELNTLALFPELPASVTPIGFPIRSKKRDAIRDHLIKKRIYPPVHWRIKETVPVEFSDSHSLSESILTLPCDQRYNSVDMERIVECLAEVM